MNPLCWVNTQSCVCMVCTSCTQYIHVYLSLMEPECYTPQYWVTSKLHNQVDYITRIYWELNHMCSLYAYAYGLNPPLRNPACTPRYYIHSIPVQLLLGKWEQAHLVVLLEWISVIVVSWLQAVYGVYIVSCPDTHVCPPVSGGGWAWDCSIQEWLPVLINYEGTAQMV